MIGLDHLFLAGWVLWPLIGCLVVISFGCTFRWLTVREVSRVSFDENSRSFSGGGSYLPVFRDLPQKLSRPEFREVMDPILKDLSSYRQLIFSLTALAPLLGLLGTVEGMIETFDSLADMQMFSQGGGIAAGVSQALVSTQLGLVIAVPSLISARLINQREEHIRDEIQRMEYVLCSEGGES